ncbi:MAG: T9SS type A sorting domain-containing protein [Candidatus Neomarinimicrobiota bacterium]
MKKLTLIALLLVLSGAVRAQADSIFTVISGDTVTVWHQQTTRNCCSLFDLRVTMSDNLITITETDTAEYLCYCTCTFDLSVVLTGLGSGFYVVEIYGTDYVQQAYWGSTTFQLGDGLDVYKAAKSECLVSRDDTSFIELQTSADTLNLFWDTPELNCCLEPVWFGWLTADTFHLTMTDVGAPCDCLCPFEVSAGFGPFAAGTYILDFLEGTYGYPQFTIGDIRSTTGLTVVSQNQSACYHVAATAEDAQPQEYLLLPVSPNPFNSRAWIGYYLPTTVPVRLEIYDIRGRLVTTLVDRNEVAGFNSVVWDGTDKNGMSVGTGVYLCYLKAGPYQQTQKLVLLK